MEEVSHYTRLFEPSTPERRAPSVVFLTGAEDSSVADALVPSLVSKGHRVAVVQLPGYGRDADQIRQVGAHGTVDTVKGELAHFINEPEVILVGHSIGGLVACILAEKGRPQVRGLVLLAPAFRIHRKNDRGMALVTRLCPF